MPQQVPELGARYSDKSTRNGIGLRQPACTNPGVIMLVKLGDDERRRNRLPSLTFLAITVVPWVVMIWLLWPRR